MDGSAQEKKGIKVQGQVRLRRVQVHLLGILHSTTIPKTWMGLTYPLVALRKARMFHVEDFYTRQGFRIEMGDWAKTKVLVRNCFHAYPRKPH